MSEVKKGVRKLRVYQVGLVACIVLAVALGGFFYSTDQAQINNLEANNDALQSQVNALTVEIAGLRYSFNELNNSYHDLYQTYLSFYQFLYDDQLNTPISRRDAVIIALNETNLSATELAGSTVSVRLIYAKFEYTWPNGRGYEVLHEVTEPVPDYSPVRVNITKYDYVVYRYLWSIGIQHKIYVVEGYWIGKTQGRCLFDASTGELFHFPYFM